MRDKAKEKENTPASPKKALKCYYCNGIIEGDDYVIKPIPLNTKAGVRNYKRKFHLDCVPKIVSTRADTEKMKQETSDWDKCYELMKKLLGINKGQNLDEHCVKRLLGMRIGQYYPSGNNVKGLARGYDYETILMTLKFCSGQIRTALGTMAFQNQNHKIDYIMKIVTSNINFISSKVESSRRTKAKLERMETEVEAPAQVAEYVKKGKPQEGKINQLVSELKESAENKEEEDIMLLFTT